MNRRFVCIRLMLMIALLVSAVWVVPSALAAAQTISVAGAATGRVFDGVGTLSAGASSRFLIDYPEPQRSQILDYLFLPNYGAAQQILKVEIGGDTISTGGSEPSIQINSTDPIDCNRGYQWWLMEQARARNPNIILFGEQWGAPGWLGGGTVYTSNNINFLLNWLDCATQHGLTINYMGGWNERSSSARIQWYKNYRAALDARGYTNVKLLMGDEDGNGTWDSYTSLNTDAALRASIAVLGGHYACRGSPKGIGCSSGNNPSAQNLGMPLWASEMGSDPYSTPASLARALNNHYIDGKITAAINWSTAAAWYKNVTTFWNDGLLLANTPWSGSYIVSRSAVWAMAHTAQFTQPGWRYLDTASGRIGGGSSTANGTYVTLKSPDDANWSTIIETTQASGSSTFTIDGITAPTVYVWSSNLGSSSESAWFAQQTPLTPVGGSLTLTVQPNSLYTLTTLATGGKGTAAPPTAATMPIPYTENFENYPVGATPKYWSDQEGTWQVAPCSPAHGGSSTDRCLQQIALQRPIGWRTNISWSYTLIGDPDWSGAAANYRASVDASFQQAGYMELLGHVDGFDLSPAGLSGYHFRVNQNGAWSLYSESLSKADTTLSSGTVASLAGDWHNISLSFTGNQITALIDNVPVTTVSNSSHPTGQSGLLIDTFRAAQFDNFRISSSSVDDIAPTTNASLSPAAVGGFRPAPTTVTLSATDVGSGVAATEYQLDGGNTTTYSGPFQISADGPHTLTYASRDSAGNIELTRTLNLTIDAVAPTSNASISPAPVSGVYTDPTITISATDGSGSGVASTQYSIDGGSFVTYSGPFHISTSGAHTLLYRSTDAVGNVESNKTLNFTTADTNPPTTSAGAAPAPVFGYYADPTTITLSAIDDTGGSGVAAIQYQLDGGTTTTYSGPFQVTGAGQHTLTFASRDNAGNVEATRTLEIVIGTPPPDTTAPTTSASLAPAAVGGFRPTSTTVTLSASDVGYGVDKTEYQLDGGGWTTYSAPFPVGSNGAHTLVYRSTDLAGNVEASQTLSFIVDANAPTSSASLSPAPTGGSYPSPTTVTLSASDGSGSGVVSTQYRLDSGSFVTYSGPFQVSAGGAHTVVYRSTDAVGNVEANKTLSFNIGDSFVPQNLMTAAATSTASGFPASQAIDGNNSTIWHAQFSPLIPLPQSLTVDLGKTYTLTKITVLPRQDSASGGRITGYQILVSTNGTTFTQVASGTWATTTALKTVTFSAPTAARYVRITATSGTPTSGQTASISEFNAAFIDITAPTTSASLSPAPVLGGAYADPTTVTLSASDGSGIDASGVASIQYSVDGGSFVAYSGPFQVGGSGNHTIQYRATDFAGNVEATKTQSFSILDFSAVDINGFEGTSFNEWIANFTVVADDEYHALVDWGDGTPPEEAEVSGSCCSFVVVGSHNYADDGVYDVTVTLTDSAGGLVSDSSLVTISNVAPSVDAGPSGAISEGSSFSGAGSFTDPGADSWTATVDYGDGSGVQPLALSGTSFALNHTYADSGSYTITVNVTDDEGDSGSDTTTVIVSDATAPTASPTQSPAANANGWNNTGATVTWNWADKAGGLGVDLANCTTTSVSSGEGAQTLNASCSDLAGNAGSASYDLKVDTTAPSISAAATSAPNANGWYKGDVTVHFSCADNLSGVASCPANQTLSGEGASISSTPQTVGDLAGNTSAPSNVVAARIDRTTPVVSVSGVTDGASYILGAIPAAACSTSDALSGVASAATLTISGGTLAGTGTFTATCAGATDRAGNAASAKSLSYNVLPPFIVRNAPVLNSSTRIEGTLWLLSGAATTLNGNATITGDLLVPGSPTVVRNGSSSLGATVAGSGSATPSGYRLTLNSSASINRLVTRIDPIALPTVPAPPAPSGTRNVSINQPGQSIGDPATLCNLTLNSNAGAVAAPPGTYGQWTANGNARFVLGVAGASEPAVYNLQSLTLNANSRLEVVGPVVLNLASGMTWNSTAAGSGAEPGWLTVNVASGAVTFDGSSSFTGTLRAPASTVTLNSTTQLAGSLIADRLTLNGSAVVR